ncbi:unnamed protein product [Brugia pahangi]|uniref:Uncharacterized protein n=1 Tax=Brugia pahangi TaxID=6280 RepID=A0A0N4TGV8_BRUPA|nr:unnamed protein product [Brugia pahangi]
MKQSLQNDQNYYIKLAGIFYPYSLFPLRLQLHIMKLLMYLHRAPLPAITTMNPENHKMKNS